MNKQSINIDRHLHALLIDNATNERNTRWVVILTSVMMVGEVIGGLIFNSLAVLADGFHMGTDALALGVTLLAYWFARRNARNPQFTFGTGKVNQLGGYTSAILLLIGSLIVAGESVNRFLHPLTIHYGEAIIIAAIGLGANLLSAWILRDRHAQGRNQAKSHNHHDYAQNDPNIKAAYLHVLADALTSILAIIALTLGLLFGWAFMDPITGIIGSIIILRWSIGLLRETSGVLLDRLGNSGLTENIRMRFESEATVQVNDIHLWEVGSSRYALIVSLQADNPKPVEYYKDILKEFPSIVHATVEIYTS
jgi:cation diffusion facilitator family transporter